MWQAPSAPVGFQDVSFDMTADPNAFRTALTEERVVTGYDADKERQALRTPSSTILKMSEDFRRAAVGRRTHQWYQDPEETADVDDEDQALYLRKKFHQERVEEQTKKNHSVEKQRALPSLWYVRRVVEHDKTLNHGTS